MIKTYKNYFEVALPEATNLGAVSELHNRLGLFFIPSFFDRLRYGRLTGAPSFVADSSSFGVL